MDRSIESIFEALSVGNGLTVYHPFKSVSEDAVAALNEADAPVRLGWYDVQHDAVTFHVGAKGTSEVATLVDAQVVGEPVGAAWCSSVD